MGLGGTRAGTRSTHPRCEVEHRVRALVPAFDGADLYGATVAPVGGVLVDDKMGAGFDAASPFESPGGSDEWGGAVPLLRTGGPVSRNHFLAEQF